MEIFHFYYFFTLLLAIAVPLAFVIRTRFFVSPLFLFPLVYIIYSFIGPLPLILGEKFENISRAFLVWEKIFPLEDRGYIYTAHTIFLVFYLTWFAGFFFAHRWSYKPIKYAIVLNEAVLKYRNLIFITACLCGFFTIYIVYINFGINFWLIYGHGSRILYQKYGTLFGTLYSLWGSSLICYAALVFLYIRKTARKNNKYLWFLVVHSLIYLGFAILRGDRSQLFVVLLGILILYSYILKPLRFCLPVMIYSFFLLFIFYLIGRFRGERLFLFGNVFLTDILTFHGFVRMAIYPFVSVESFAAYTALPFLLANEIPFVYGRSIAAFFVALLPRVVAPFRPPSGFTYTRYAEYAGILELKQGFTFHHVADWYWNFSWCGVLFGGFLIGYLFGKLERKISKSDNVFWVVVLASTLGHLPTSLRAPIEGIRAIFYEYWLLPFIFFVLLPHFLGKKREITYDYIGHR